MKSIIVDLGSSSIKLGFNNEDNPKYELPSYIGETYEQIIYGKIIKNENNKYISSSCDELINNLKLYYPIKNGYFINPDDINIIFDYLFKKLGLNSAQDISTNNILITEPLFSFGKNKKNISEILFEKMNISSILFAPQPFLSFLGTGKTTGTVLESGDMMTQTCVIIDGYPIPKTFLRFNYGGKNVTDYLFNLLRKKGYFNNNRNNYEIVKKIKEKFSCTRDYKEEKESEENFSYELPDETKIIIGEERRFCPYSIFDEKLLGKENLKMDKMICNSINNADINLSLKLYEDILLSGGNTLIKGFRETLYKDIQSNFNKNIKVRLYTPKNPQNCCWIGGKVISSNNNFKNMWITKEEWKEKGEKILQEKSI